MFSVTRQCPALICALRQALEEDIAAKHRPVAQRAFFAADSAALPRQWLTSTDCYTLCQAAAGSLDPRKRVAFEVRRVRSEDGGYPHFYEHLDIERPLGRS